MVFAIPPAMWRRLVSIFDGVDAAATLRSIMGSRVPVVPFSPVEHSHITKEETPLDRTIYFSFIS